MSDIKCPFCQQKLKDQWVGQNVAHEYFDCPKCKMNGNPKLWQELIRTRKALEILQEFIMKLYLNGDITDERLKRHKKMLITALEQKEHFADASKTIEQKD